MRSSRLVFAFLVSGLCTAAFAQTSSIDQMHSPDGLFDATPHARPHQIALWGDLDWGGIGVGARYNLPILGDGFIPELNDSFEVEVGADFYFSTWGYCGLYSCTSGSRLDVLGEARWTFHLFPKFSAYAKVSVGPSIWFGGNPTFHFNIGPGVIYQFSDKMDVRAEVGYSGFHVGLGWSI